MKKVPAILAGIYGALVILSAVPIFTGDDALSGIFLVVLGTPWTQLITAAIDAVNPAAFDNLVVGLVAGFIGGAINAAIIYFVAKWVVGRFAK